MPTKTTKKASVKSEFSTSKVGDEKKTKKKGVVKRRKLDLTPTRASAVAIASQAAKKQALIDKVAANGKINNPSDDSTKIPTWVWVFFWWSLLLFCVSFYQAIIRPQLETELTQANVDESIYWVDWDNVVSLWWNSGERNNIEVQGDNQWFQMHTPTDAAEAIEEFFARLSNNYYDEAYSLFNPTLQRSSEIREHFTSFRMSPFVEGLQWELKPTNLKYISTSTSWKDRYSFDLSYTLNDGQQFDESWEFVVDNSGSNPLIASIMCVTKKCSRHPIFWPENFGLMR